MSSKSAVKALDAAADGGLFKLVAMLTGSKNALKGVGFFLGAALLASIGYVSALWLDGMRCSQSWSWSSS
jgi:hypothetical protein